MTENKGSSLVTPDEMYTEFVEDAERSEINKCFLRAAQNLIDTALEIGVNSHDFSIGTLGFFAKEID